MNKTKKNIVVCCFDDFGIRNINPAIIGKNYYVDSYDEAMKHQGYLLIINNLEHLSLVNFDKKYRKKLLSKYEWIIMYDEYNKIYRKKDKFSNIEVLNYEFLFNGIFDYVWENFDNYKEKLENSKKIKYTSKRINMINDINNYLKDYKTITSKEISDKFNMSIRNVERYMMDINKIYKTVGYDYSNNKWYIL